MKLVASLIVHNEMGRYLPACVDHLRAFCDEVAVWDDGSTDDTIDYLGGLSRVRVGGSPTRDFFGHEGRARQQLLDWTLAAKPTHVLAIDADEFVSDGLSIRAWLEDDDRYPTQVWTLCMREVWEADRDGLKIRQDGGWVEHHIPAVWRVPVPAKGLRLVDKALACGRLPAVHGRWRRDCLPAEILHFGWANHAERRQRHDRYARHDGGRFHASQHLDSILWPPERVLSTEDEWPAGLDAWRYEIVAGAVRDPA